MQVFHQLNDVKGLSEASSVAIGNFDGVHLGHQSLLKNMLLGATSEKTKSLVLTFFPHPVEVLNPGKPLSRLTTTAEKLYELQRMGVESVLVAPFDKPLAAETPEIFFQRFLIEGLHAKTVHVGTNFRFGRARSGDTETLRSLCQQAGVFFSAVPAVLIDGVRVSSSEIRKLIALGEVVKAARLLGRPYAMQGQVVHGDERGAQLGFPTANLNCPADKLIPSNGVYITRARWQQQWYGSVTNVGVRPTFDGSAARTTIETHLLDFSSKIYDESLRLEFLERIRDEQKFGSLEALKRAIANDVQTARGYDFSKVEKSYG